MSDPALGGATWVTDYTLIPSVSQSCRASGISQRVRADLSESMIGWCLSYLLLLNNNHKT